MAAVNLTPIDFITDLLRTANVVINSQCGYGSKINIQRPRAPHYLRALMYAATEPVYPRVTAVDKCQEKQKQKNAKKKQQEYAEKNPELLHPYHRLLKNQMYKHFDEAKMVLICHKNSMSGDEFFKFSVACFYKNIQVKTYGSQIVRSALQDTRFEAMLPVLTSSPHACLLFSNEWNVRDALQITKKMSKVVILCGSLGDRFLARTELEQFSMLPDITTAQAQFVATLNSIGSQLVNNLQAHQTNLTQLLDARADSLKEPTSNSNIDGESP